MPIQGSLQDMSVLEAVQLVGTQRKTVTLKVESGDEEAQLHFRDGTLIASHRRGVGRGEPFLEAMVALSHLSPAEAMRIGQQIAEEGRDLWNVVREIPHLTLETCERVYLQVTEATIDRVLLWEQGHFALLPAFRVEAIFTPPLSVDTVLLDSMRRLDELASWKQRDFPPGSVPCLNGPEELYVCSDPLRRAVVRQIDGHRNIAQLVEATRLGEYDVFAVLGAGLEEGWIQVLAPSSKRSPRKASIRPILSRWSAVAVIVCLLLLTATVAWVGDLLEPASGPWAQTQAQWEETDLRRMIETYRYRHDRYPSGLGELEDDRLPVGNGAAERWDYQPKDQGYVLRPR